MVSQRAGTDPSGAGRPAWVGCRFVGVDTGARMKGLDERDLLALCERWPGVTHALRYEAERVWTVRGRRFAVLSLFGPDRGRLSLRVDREHFVELRSRAGITPAPYEGQAFWISIDRPDGFDQADLALRVRRSYELVRADLPERVRRVLEEAGTTPGG